MRMLLATVAMIIVDSKKESDLPRSSNQRDSHNYFAVEVLCSSQDA